MGVIGLLGSGNLGNDGSLEALITKVRSDHPNVVFGCLCDGPQQVTTRFGIPAKQLFWNLSTDRPAFRNPLVRIFGKLLDTIRVFSWARRFDAVVVPGMGVLEDCLRVQPWGLPYSLFVLAVTGRLTGTRVALVNVGATVVEQPTTRWFVTRIVRLVDYRSYRDAFSRDAMRSMGIDEPADCVFPDLAFGLPDPRPVDVQPGSVGVGVMNYWGENSERHRADEIHARYVGEMKRFVRWLVDQGRPIRLLTGDRSDDDVVREILRDVHVYRPDLGPDRVIAEPIRTMSDLMDQMSSVDTIVATRYHNILAAIKLSKPTLSIGYGLKNDVLMTDRGMSDFCHQIRTLDFARLCEQFTELEGRRESLVSVMRERNEETKRRLAEQLSALSAELLDGKTGSRRPRLLRR